MTNISSGGKSCEHGRDPIASLGERLMMLARTQKMSTPYFREWSNMRLHKGKSFLAPPALFRAERALYFPNLHGQTLLKDKKPRDTTPVLEDKISVVSVFSSAWAENQAATFASEKQNPELHEALRSSGGAAQLVQINYEDNALKAMIVRMFMPNLRKRLGVTDEMRDAIGLLNSKVGYTYLLDSECKIRWAASGPSEGDEKEGLVKGVRRLVDELKNKRASAAAPTPQQVAGTPKATPARNQKRA
jgi:ATPase complex subunit ATP10